MPRDATAGAPPTPRFNNCKFAIQYPVHTARFTGRARTKSSLIMVINFYLLREKKTIVWNRRVLQIRKNRVCQCRRKREEEREETFEKERAATRDPRERPSRTICLFRGVSRLG